MNNKKQKLRTAVVGLGRIGWQFHVPEIVKHDNFELAAVVDPLAERLTEAKTEYGVTGYHDYVEMLQIEKPDLVVLASPSNFHCEQTMIAFDHGCDVFCEKPIALSLDEVDEILAAMKSTKRKIMAYQPHRCYSDVISLLHILSLDLLGPVYMVKRCSSDFTRRCDWQAFQKYGGGMLNNYGSHFIDQFMYLTDFPKINDLKCITKNIVTLGDAEDFVKVIIDTDRGVLLDLDINMASAINMPEWQVFGYYGSAILERQSNIWKVKYFHPEELDDIPVRPELAAPGRKYANGERIPWRLKEFDIEDFQGTVYYDKCYEYFALDKQPFVPIEQSRKLMEILGDCRKKACQYQCL